jgi:hypothetical protein
MTPPVPRRTAEQLLADAEERLRATAELPHRMADVRGSAENADRTVRAVVDVHGALRGLELGDAALAAGPDRLGEEIVRVAAEAHRAALRDGAATIGDTLGDAAALEALHSAGLSTDPDAPVLPYTPGVDPNAHRWNVIPGGHDPTPAANTATPRANTATPGANTPGQG